MLVPGGSILEVFGESGTQRHLQRAEGPPGSSPETSQAPPKQAKRGPRDAQGQPKGAKSSPHPKGAQRPPKGIQKDVGGDPKQKEGALQQTSLFTMFELHKHHPGTPRRPPKVNKNQEESTRLHQSMPKRSKRAPKAHRERLRDATEKSLETLG